MWKLFDRLLTMESDTDGVRLTQRTLSRGNLGSLGKTRM